MFSNWHSIKIEEVFKKTRSSEEGLTEKQAKLRLGKNGENVLPEEKPYSKLRLFLSQINNPLSYILLASAVISFLLSHLIDSFFVIFVLFINVFIGFIQENKANQSLLKIKRMVKMKNIVLRNGHKKEIGSEKIVIGDVIILKEGDKIPADGRIIKSSNFKINEASLTGESSPAEKNPGVLKKATPINERTNMVYAGCPVENGKAVIIVTATAIDTEMGKIVTSLKSTEEPKTPLQKKIAFFTNWLGVVILALVFIIIIIGLMRGEAFVDIFISSLALAVSAIPEGLLPAITIVLVISMRRILKQRGLVKKLVSAEGLGSVTVVCTDKTGTLTRGEMRVSQVLTTESELLNNGISGSKIDSNGTESHILALKIGALVNDAFIENPGEELKRTIVRGQPTDRAMLLAGLEAGLDRNDIEKKHSVVEKMPFNNKLRISAYLSVLSEKENQLFVAGAPENIIKKSNSVHLNGKDLFLDNEIRLKLNSKLESLASKGLRIVACAYRKTTNKNARIENLLDNFNFIGFLALKDPLRPDAKSSIKTIIKAGIRPILITGDHQLTAKTIANEIGLKVSDENIITGEMLDKISEEELATKVRKCAVFARTLPQQKLRIIKSLHKNKEVVTMFGDGINDAPALKAADVGVAVDSGTAVAKETADVILLDDNFKTICNAIQQGRLAFNNLRRIFIYLIADDFSEIFLFLLALFLGCPLPLLPAQILWINLIEDGFPGVALTAEKEGEKELMNERPRNPNEPFISGSLKKWAISIFFITTASALIFYLLTFPFLESIEKARTLLFAFISIDSLFLALSVRSFKTIVFRKNIFSNWLLTGSILLSFIFLIAAVHLPFLQKIMGTVPLSLSDWLLVIGFGILEMIIIETFKFYYLIRNRKKRLSL